MPVPPPEDEKAPAEGESLEPELKQDDKADSSSADGEKDPGTMLDAINKAVSGQQGEQSPGSEEGRDTEAGEAEGESEKKADEPEEDLGDVTEEELSRYKPRTARRIRGLLGQIQERDSRLADLEPKAQQFEQITSYVQNAGLDRDEVNAGFEIMRAMKQEPARAWEMLQPYIATLRNLVGEELPQELQQQVQQGILPEDAARQMARLQAGQRLAQEQAQRARQAAEQRQQQEAVRSAQQQAAQAVTQWERDWSQQDPDYRAKVGLVQEKIELAFHRFVNQNRRPPNAEEAVTMARTAREQVDGELKRFQPKKPEIKPVTGQTAGQPSRPKPQTMKDVVDMALEG